jgi:hypothetical protein
MTTPEIRERPLVYQIVEGDVRRPLTRRFPYGVFFPTEPRRIVVLAVLHTARDPRVWQSRVRSEHDRSPGQKDRGGPVFLAAVPRLIRQPCRSLLQSDNHPLVLLHPRPRPGRRAPRGFRRA